MVTSLRRALRPLRAHYDHILIDTHGDTGNLTLAAVAAADAVISGLHLRPGSALGAVRTATFVSTHQNFENTDAVLLGAVCSNWDAAGAAARGVAEALESTGLDAVRHPHPVSRRVPSAMLAKRPVVLTATRRVRWRWPIGSSRRS